MIENKFITLLKPYMSNKFVFIMMLKLLKVFIEVGDSGTFRYLFTIDLFDSLRLKYA